jgi:Cft2 family RNA processing exonuclease
MFTNVGVLFCTVSVPCLCMHSTMPQASNHMIYQSYRLHHDLGATWSLITNATTVTAFPYLQTQSIEQFQDIQPCVVMASPGMLQSGVSRQLFDRYVCIYIYM